MGIVLDSGVLIASEREAKPVSELLTAFEREHRETEIVLSSITVIELEHGMHRAETDERARKRRDYLDTVFAAIPVQPFTREMAQNAEFASLPNDSDADGASTITSITQLHNFLFA